MLLAEIARTSSDVAATPDPRVPPQADWARYVIEPGAHAANVISAAAGNPLAGLVRGVEARTYDLAFDVSAMYAITNPKEPNARPPLSGRT